MTDPICLSANHLIAMASMFGYHFWFSVLSYGNSGQAFHDIQLYDHASLHCPLVDKLKGMHHTETACCMM